MQFQPLSTRTIALLTGTVLAAGTLFHPTPARADKAKTYKYGAIALGVAAAYMAAKGKTVPAAVAAAGGYYAYKKSQKAKDATRYGYYPDSNSGSNSNSGAVYPDDNGTGTAYRSSAVKNPTGFDLSPYLR